MTSATDGRRLALVAAVVGLAAGLLSLARLWIANQQALTEVIWAEDGVFPLCVRKAGFLTCLVDPYAGYLHFVPRFFAGLVSLLPVEDWALATNLLAAAFAGVVAALAVVVMRRFGIGWFSSVVLGLLPVAAPVLSFEAINSLACSYMLLLYLSALVLAFPERPENSRKTYAVAVAALLLLTTLTIPFAGVFLALLVVQVCRRTIAMRASIIYAAAIVVGLVAQGIASAQAEKPRPIDISGEHLSSWINSLPDTLLTYWPGLRLGDFTFFDVFPVSPVGVTGAFLAVALVIGGLALLFRGGDRRVGIGLLLLTGVALGAIPVIISGTNNRYFVVPVLLWGAALMVGLDPVIRRARVWVVALVTALVLVVWWPAIPANWFRSTPAPPWSAEVARVEAKCTADPGFTDRIIFSPFWPPNWGDALSEPTHPDIPCLVVWKWG